MPKRTRTSMARTLAGLALVVVLAGCTPEEIIRFTWRDDPQVADQAVDVATCESTLNPDARSGPNLGLFQLNWHYHAWRATEGADPFDALTNTIVAHDLWAEQGWRPWTCRP